MSRIWSLGEAVHAAVRWTHGKTPWPWSAPAAAVRTVPFCSLHWQLQFRATRSRLPIPAARSELSRFKVTRFPLLVDFPQRRPEAAQALREVPHESNRLPELRIPPRSPSSR